MRRNPLPLSLIPWPYVLEPYPLRSFIKQSLNLPCGGMALILTREDVLDFTALKIEHIDHAGCYMYVTSGKGDKPCICIIPQTALEILGSYLQGGNFRDTRPQACHEPQKSYLPCSRGYSKQSMSFFQAQEVLRVYALE